MYYLLFFEDEVIVLSLCLISESGLVLYVNLVAVKSFCPHGYIQECLVVGGEELIRAVFL